MITTEDGEHISEAEHLASVIRGTGKTTIKAVARPFIVRTPIYLLADIDAMAKSAGQSRNSMAIQLLNVAIEATKANLDTATRQKIDGDAFEAMTVFLANSLENEQVEV